MRRRTAHAIESSQITRHKNAGMGMKNYLRLKELGIHEQIENSDEG
jgi:hypothetical protein